MNFVKTNQGRSPYEKFDFLANSHLSKLERGVLSNRPCAIVVVCLHCAFLFQGPCHRLEVCAVTSPYLLVNHISESCTGYSDLQGEILNSVLSQ